MQVCYSSPAWVGYGSQERALKMAKPGYASRLVDSKRMGAIRRLLAACWQEIEFRCSSEGPVGSESGFGVMASE